jgi:hypothetical protein
MSELFLFLLSHYPAKIWALEKTNILRTKRYKLAQPRCKMEEILHCHQRNKGQEDSALNKYRGILKNLITEREKTRFMFEAFLGLFIFDLTCTLVYKKYVKSVRRYRTTQLFD